MFSQEAFTNFYLIIFNAVVWHIFFEQQKHWILISVKKCWKVFGSLIHWNLFKSLTHHQEIIKWRKTPNNHDENLVTMKNREKYSANTNSRTGPNFGIMPIAILIAQPYVMFCPQVHGFSLLTHILFNLFGGVHILNRAHLCRIQLCRMYSRLKLFVGVYILYYYYRFLSLPNWMDRYLLIDCIVRLNERK